MCIKPTNPFGAGSDGLCFLHHCAGIKMHSNITMAFMKSTTALFVSEISSGRTSFPSTCSQILSLFDSLPEIYNP